MITPTLLLLLETWLMSGKIDLDDQVTCFTTDNGSDVVKMLREDLVKMYILCAGHK